ncbi:hypothetical protein F477_02661, partial [Pseudomonas sp. URIL14HWK12:I3]
NNKMSWQDMLAWLREKRWQSLGFGGVTYLALLIPGVNVVMMPAAVAGRRCSGCARTAIHVS